jgi:hypothetical protein
MMSAEAIKSQPSENESIDWLDIKATACIGVFFAGLRGRLDHNTLVMMVVLLCLFYIGWRCRGDIHKLKEWGITLDNFWSASFVAFILTIIATVVLASITYMKVGKVSLDPELFSKMVLYIQGAFPQQFLLFGLVFGNLSKLPVLCGRFSLPIVGGLFFAALHLHAPFQMIGTFVLGFVCITFFLHFRTILPLIAMHAYLQPLNAFWIRRAFEY